MPSNGPDEVERLCELVRAAHPGLEEAVKWGRPTFAAIPK